MLGSAPPELGTLDVQSSLGHVRVGVRPASKGSFCTAAEACRPLLQFLGRAPGQSQSAWGAPYRCQVQQRTPVL